MEVNVFNSRNEMGEAAAEAVASKILGCLDKKESIRMVFAAAPSQNGFLESLLKIKNIPWNRVVAFHMDEYLGLPNEHPALFANFLNNKLFDRIPLKEVHLIDGNNDPLEECRRYTELLEQSPIDMVCMGIGENGHIAFNDPPVADFNDSQLVKLVELDEVCKQQQVNDGCFDSLKAVPTHAITLTVPALLNTDFICCVVPGSQKKEAVHQTLYGPIDEHCPASVLRGHWNCQFFTDKDALPLVEPWKSQEALFVMDILSRKLCITEEAKGIRSTAIKVPENVQMQIPFYGPGLIDLQVNGIAGADFNEKDLTLKAVRGVVTALLGKGVTGFFPTLITNDPQIVEENLKIIDQACREDALIHSCILGIHLEGPFISPQEGAKGAHPEKYIQKPNWELVKKFQQISGGRIKLITLAPELEGALELIKQCKEEGILTAIGHSSATCKDIEHAISAGASLSTHLGNAIPLILPRHPNILWDQLAEEGLFTSLIADGFHLDQSFLKTVLKVKGEKAFLISDSTKFCGMAPGTYQSPIGEEIILEENGRLSMKHGNGLLAGAAKNLLEGIEYLITENIIGLPRAWKLASLVPQNFAKLKTQPDRVVFSIKNGNSIQIQKVIKNGKIIQGDKI
jgi:glucosamine-6-phosphate deaminase